jgi:hypothetical protein
VSPAAQVFIPPLPPHESWQPPGAPQVRLHVAAPLQLREQSPSWQVTSQVELPSHVTIPPLPTERVQVLPPAQLDVQLAPHVSEHCAWPSQVELQPVPQTEVHVACEVHW